jgi:hypothetical protein
VTLARSPTVTEGAELVKTKMPSDVPGSESADASGSCRKNPLLFSAVTTPRVVTELPTSGETFPDPWMA